MKNSDTLIKNACIYDGTANKPFYADLLIREKLIKSIGRDLPATDCLCVDAAGLALAPGFINTHSHMELEVLKDPSLPSVIQQGITTEVLGQDGSSVAPLHDGLLQELADNMAPLAGRIQKPYPWRRFGEYLQTVERVKPAARFVSLVGHGTIRMNVMGSERRQPTQAELEQMKQMLAQCLQEGAKGLSFGLIYPPGSYGDTDELIQLAKVVAAYDGIVMVHMRNEKDKLLESIREMKQVVEESGVRLQISHFKSLGQVNWGKVREGLDMVQKMQDQGFDITFDQYPWTAACTGLKVCVPQWAFAGGEQEFQKRLADPIIYKKIRKETADEISVRGGGKSILIAETATQEYKWMAGKRMDEISQRLQLSTEDAVLKILQHEGPLVIAIYFSISEDDVVQVMKSPFHCVCTDGIMGAFPHPRTYASFPRFLGHYVRDLGVMPLEQAIQHITQEPARRLRLWDRGMIREGLSAVLVLFDPEKIADINSYLDPTVTPVGIQGVWVEGVYQYGHVAFSKQAE